MRFFHSADQQLSNLEELGSKKDNFRMLECEKIIDYWQRKGGEQSKGEKSATRIRTNRQVLANHDQNSFCLADSQPTQVSKSSRLLAPVVGDLSQSTRLEWANGSSSSSSSNSNLRIEPDNRRACQRLPVALTMMRSGASRLGGDHSSSSGGGNSSINNINKSSKSAPRKTSHLLWLSWSAQQSCCLPPKLLVASSLLLLLLLQLSIVGPKSVDAVDCFKCSSRNGSNPACEDPFHNLNTTRITQPVVPDPMPSVIYHTPCYAGKKGRDGLFPASACIKLTGTFARMSHCGKFQFEGDLLAGCVLACPEDACNSASLIMPSAFLAAVSIAATTSFVFTKTHSTKTTMSSR